ncbi:hypothetical protein LJC60_01830 [Ruminococcaceae bacterium OttesenSCG-928-D13]|nr:hypothetical protein [Ruminococcaceae bacterium OttesenSCG-928-D13]
MNEELRRKLPLRILVLISSPKLAEKAAGVLGEGHLPIQYQMRGAGTAQSEMMDMIGLGGTAKTVTISMMPKVYAAAMLDRLDKELGLGRPNTGVAFTTAITGINAPAMKLMDEKIREEFKKTMDSDMKQMTQGSTHSMIVAIVNQGFSEDVMEAARAAGARGGTVLHARQMGGQEAMKLWGITIQEEKEFVLILADAGSKIGIMKAIGEKCGLASEARGLVLSSPVDMLAGMEGA